MYEKRLGAQTKARIFSAALRMFATSGVENTSTKLIAAACDISEAALYRHYKSKDEMLELCYQYFVDHINTERLTKEQYLPILREGTKEEVIKIPNYTIPEDKAEEVVFSLMLICARIHTDTRARDIYIANKQNAMAYLKEFFEAGIEISRFGPFDFEPVSRIYLSIKLNAAHCVSIDPEDNEHLLENQTKMLRALIDIIPFRY